MLPKRGSSAGGCYSTVENLLAYTVALRKASFAPTSFKEREGFVLAGGFPGGNAVVDFNPASGYTIIVLSNYDPPIAEKIARHIHQLLPR